MKIRYLFVVVSFIFSVLAVNAQGNRFISFSTSEPNVLVNLKNVKLASGASSNKIGVKAGENPVEWHQFSENEIKTISFQKNEKEFKIYGDIEVLFIEAKELAESSITTNLDISRIKSLKRIYAESLRLVNFVAGSQPNLEYLALQANLLESLDLTGVGASLTHLSIDVNPLSELKLGDVSKLEAIGVSSTNLQYLDLEGANSLKQIVADNSKLSSVVLPISQTNLRGVLLSNNNLSACALDDIYKSLTSTPISGAYITIGDNPGTTGSNIPVATGKNWKVHTDRVNKDTPVQTSVDCELIPVISVRFNRTSNEQVSGSFFIKLKGGAGEVIARVPGAHMGRFDIPEEGRVLPYNEFVDGYDLYGNVEEFRITPNPTTQTTLSLDLSKNNLLKKVHARDNKITDVIFGNQKNLESIILQSNHLESLDLTGVGASLTHMSIDINPLSELKLGDVSKLEAIGVSSTNLQYLDLEGANSLKQIVADNSKLSSVVLPISQTNLGLGIFLSNNNLSACALDDIYKSLTSTPISGSYITIGDNPGTTGSNIPVATGKNWEVHTDRVNKNTPVQTGLDCPNSQPELSSMRKIVVKNTASSNISGDIYIKVKAGTDKIALVKDGVVGEDAIQWIIIPEGQTELIVSYEGDIRGYTLYGDIEEFVMEKPIVEGDYTSAVDLSGNDLLKKVVASGVMLTEVIIGQQSDLQYLDVQNNKLTEVNLSGASGLSTLLASRNPLTHIRLGDINKIEEIDVHSTQLTELDLSNLVRLRTLTAYESKLNRVTLTNKSIELNRVYLNDNELSACELDNIYRSLNSTLSSSKRISIADNPGAKGTKQSIAKTKAWRVQEKHNSSTAIINVPNESGVLEYCDQVVGILALKDNIIGLRIYPNPVDEELFVDSKEELVLISFFSITGQEVIRRNLDDFNEKYRLDCSELPRGIYVLRLTAKSGKTVLHKIVKK